MAQQVVSTLVKAPLWLQQVSTSIQLTPEEEILLERAQVFTDVTAFVQEPSRKEWLREHILQPETAKAWLWYVQLAVVLQQKYEEHMKQSMPPELLKKWLLVCTQRPEYRHTLLSYMMQAYTPQVTHTEEAR